MISTLALAWMLVATPLQPGQESVVVSGERIRDLRAALRACLQRACPPNEDVDASLALAEGELLNGDYEDAESTIAGSLRRNGRHVQRHPEAVADLYRSQARVQSHRGRDREALLSTRSILRALRAGMPQEDHRHFTARLEIAELLTRGGDLRGARAALIDLIEQAQRAGRNDVVRMAEMRRLRLDYALDPSGRAWHRLRELAASDDPARRFETAAARLFLARVYRQRGDIEQSDAMLAAIPRGEGDSRRLLHHPPYDLAERPYPSRDSEVEVGSTTRRLPDNYADRWIDVGYWIEPNGRVSGLEVVRQGASAGWAQPLLASIRGRIYEASADGQPSYRLERYTYTAPYEVVTGSRLLQRSRRARVEFMDLTTPNESGRAPDPAIRPEGS
jgi:hypothetical protein